MDEPLSKEEKRQLAKQEKVKARSVEMGKASVKKFGVWAVIIALVGFLGYRFITWLGTPSSIPQTQVGEVAPVAADEWIKGNPDAATTLIEYGDFQCPACGAYFPLVKQLVEQNPESLRVVYRHFPLVNIHPNALPAARATEAAGLQGKFWEMHDLLFANQSEWSDLDNAQDKFIDYAGEIGLDTEQFKADMASSAVQDAINADLVTGNAAGVNSTPTFVLNGQAITLTSSATDFVTTVETALSS